MRRSLLILGFWMMLPRAEAQFNIPQSVTTHSQSGQFIVHGKGMAPSSRGVAEDKNLVFLQPVLLTVACDRIKQAMDRELGLPSSWQGKIFLNIQPASRLDNGVNVTCERFRNSWQYQIDLPDPISRGMFIKSIVQVLLTEFANRKSDARGADLPSWLIEGVTQQLLASPELQLALQAPNDSANGMSLRYTPLNQTRTNRLQFAHRSLHDFQPLSFDELSWPPDLASADRQSAFQSSAQLLVTELEAFTDGRACLRRTLEQMSQYLNWQLAFLAAFQTHFSRPLDVEKWWALRVSHFTGRELTQAWTLEESWEKLTRIIVSPVQVRTGTDDLPLHTSISLQTILRSWDSAKQSAVLKLELAQLTMLRGRIDRSLAPLLDDYREALDTYLKNHQSKGISLITFRRLGNPERALEIALKQLDSLDSRRAALKPSPPSIATNSEN
jgi:hypothetical protein